MLATDGYIFAAALPSNSATNRPLGNEIHATFVPGERNPTRALDRADPGSVDGWEPGQPVTQAPTASRLDGSSAQMIWRLDRR